MRKSSPAPPKLGALFHNGKEACPLRIALDKMGHPQPAMPMATDDSTTSGIATDIVKQKRSKAIDMRFYCIHDRIRQGQFQIYCSKQGKTNCAVSFPSIIRQIIIRLFNLHTCILLPIPRGTISSVLPMPHSHNLVPQNVSD
jgi:hypothetical protein